jgi:hypothetical protein
MPNTENLTYQETVHKILFANHILKSKAAPIVYEVCSESFKDCFVEHYPNIPRENIQIDPLLCTRDRIFEMPQAPENKYLYVPLDVFFYPYTVDPESYTVEVREYDPDIFIILTTKYFGRFFFMAGGTMDSQKTRLVLNKRYRAEEDAPNVCHHTIVCEMPHDSNHSDYNIFYLARIEPYICVNCGKHAPHMKKCEGCWKHLRMCVRYCCRECQLEDYQRMHRHVCGQNNTDHERSVRDAELKSRSAEDQALTLAAC